MLLPIQQSWDAHSACDIIREGNAYLFLFLLFDETKIDLKFKIFQYSENNLDYFIFQIAQPYAGGVPGSINTIHL